MLNLFKFALSGFAIYGVAFPLNAELPNTWYRMFAQGTLQLDMEANKKQSLRLSCNIGNEPKWDHSFTYHEKLRDGSYVSHPDLDNYKAYSLKLNNIIQPYPPLETRTTKGAIAWKKFTMNIVNANKIEILKDGKTIATFFPSFNSMKNIQGIKDCAPMRSRAAE